MAPYVPEEVDVFTIPHSRMKELVNDYVVKIESTDFSDNVDMEVFLQKLYNTFVEFKNHERIENQLIMKKLKNKLKRLSIKNQAVCNCHKDSHLLDMMQMVKEGYNKKTDQDRTNFHLRLKVALEEFTEDFLPHMKQEEEIFQPLLLQYFSYEELCDMRKRVIQYHLEQAETTPEKGAWEEVTKDIAAHSSDEEDDLCDNDSTRKAQTETEEEPGTRIDHLPHEVLLHIFSYLNPNDLGHCARTSHQWNSLAYDPSLWREIHPVQWSKGEWSYRQADEEAGLDAEDEVECHLDAEDEVYFIDEDADVDESEEFETETVRQLKHEAQILVGLSKYVLPRIGESVSILNLKNSRAITNGLVNKMLRECPNIEHLDLTQTRVSDAGLKSIGKNNCCSRLRTLVLSGCENITDTTMIRLAVAQSRPALSKQKNTPNKRNCCDEKEIAVDAADKDDVRGMKECNVSQECLCEEYLKTKQQLDECKLQTKTVDKGEMNTTGKAICEEIETENLPGVETKCDKDSSTISGATTSPVVIISECDKTENQPQHAKNDRTFDNAGAGIVLKSDSDSKLTAGRCGGVACCRLGNGDAKQKTKNCCKTENVRDDKKKGACHPSCAVDTREAIIIEECAAPKMIPHQVAPMVLAPVVPSGGGASYGAVSLPADLGGLSLDEDDGWHSRPPRSSPGRMLTHLSLSGCYQVTDVGLQALAGCGPFPHLKHLDLSGCTFVSGEGLTELVAECPFIDPEHLYYCDSILDGPFADTASGCRNLQCGSRFCCRSGE